MAVRKAGEKLTDEQRAARARRIAKSPERMENRLGRIDKEKYDVSGYNNTQLLAAMKGGSFNEKDFGRLTGNPYDDGSDDAVDDNPGGDTDGGGNDDGGNDNGGTINYPTPVDGPAPVYDPAPTPPRGYPEMPTGSGNFVVGGDLTQTIGKSGDQTVNIGNGNTFGDGANIGNDNSTTIGVQNAGNSSNAALNLHKQAKGKAAAYLQFS